jgi:hypothetical protein
VRADERVDAGVGPELDGERNPGERKRRDDD